MNSIKPDQSFHDEIDGNDNIEEPRDNQNEDAAMSATIGESSATVTTMIFL